MYIFICGYSPVSLFDILYLARDNLLNHLCCYFLLSLGRLLAALLCIKLRHKAWKNIKSFQMNFFGVGIVTYFLTLSKLTSCKKLQFLLF